MAKRKSLREKLNIDDCVPENMTFAATLAGKSIKVFVGIIKALNNLPSMETTEIQLSQAGFKYIVEESKSFQTAAYIKQNFFENFHLRMQDQKQIIMGFGINLRSFTELFTALLDDEMSSMKIVYFHYKNIVSFSCLQTDSGGEQLGNKGKQHPFGVEELTAVSVVDEPPMEIVTEYFVPTMHSKDPIDFGIISPHLANSLIINAYDFYGILNDFDRSIEGVEIKVFGRKMTLKSIGSLQNEAIVKLDQDSEIFIKFESIEPSKFTYKFSYFKAMLKTLPMASKISLVTHADGMLKIQLMIKNDDSDETLAFIEYNIVPDLPEEDDDL